jgi:hypothetical protein
MVACISIVEVGGKCWPLGFDSGTREKEYNDERREVLYSLLAAALYNFLTFSLRKSAISRGGSWRAIMV